MSYVYIDVREPDEFESGHVEGAYNIPLGEIGLHNESLRGIAKDAAVILYCRSGGRAGVAEQILKGLGYTNVTNGINAAYVQDNFTQ